MSSVSSSILSSIHITIYVFVSFCIPESAISSNRALHSPLVPWPSIVSLRWCLQQDLDFDRVGRILQALVHGRDSVLRVRGKVQHQRVRPAPAGTTL